MACLITSGSELCATWSASARTVLGWQRKCNNSRSSSSFKFLLIVLGSWADEDMPRTSPQLGLWRLSAIFWRDWSCSPRNANASKTSVNWWARYQSIFTCQFTKLTLAISASSAAILSWSALTSSSYFLSRSCVLLDSAVARLRSFLASLRSLAASLRSLATSLRSLATCCNCWATSLSLSARICSRWASNCSHSRGVASLGPPLPLSCAPFLEHGPWPLHFGSVGPQLP